MQQDPTFFSFFKDNAVLMSAIFAFLALALNAIITLWNLWLRDRVWLSVDFLALDADGYKFEVRNRGFLLVTLSKMSISLNWSKKKPTLAFKARPFVVDQSSHPKFPISLEPKTSVVVYFDTVTEFNNVVRQSIEDLEKKGWGYVFTKTASGRFRRHVFYLPDDIEDDPTIWDPSRYNTVMRWGKRILSTGKTYWCKIFSIYKNL